MRPEPGLSATVARARAAGREAIAMPLFAVAPVPWTCPSSTRIDAILVTSANAMRHGGIGLATLRDRPVVAVGEASAVAARSAGFEVAVVGTHDAASAVALARTRGFDRLLHLAGRDRVDLPGVDAIIVYASDAIDIDAEATARFVDRTVLLHSPRAARHVTALVDRDGLDRRRIGIAALSGAVAAAAGARWRAVHVAATPDDDALIAAVIATGSARD
ncbi:uroporphyrinogen-III synthase [Sphingomonas oligophenolica]|uniref:uroporphyrinogen-III synthase n=1 Tax=Sphingomonas oligophenolica TaxID=301154 RepID=UPI001F4FE432|nr:uroporphyrinogen-III synthase [Sphingomonas oligophenolica]